MKTYLTWLAALLLPLATFAQSNVMNEDPEQEVRDESVKVMIIPFHPMKMYFSDCDRDLAKESGIAREDVRIQFQAGMDYASENWIDKRYEAMNLFQMKDSMSKEVMAQFYDNVTYTYDHPTRQIVKEKKNIFAKLKESVSEATGKHENEEQSSYTTVEPEDERYMRGTIKNPEFLETMNSVYEPNYYVFINQFEVKTDFETCMDREHMKYKRRIKVHYNVYTPEGELVYGDVVTAKYNSASNNVNRIIQDNFGVLADYIKETLP